MSEQGKQTNSDIEIDIEHLFNELRKMEQEELLNVSIKELNLSNRIRHVFLSKGIKTINDLFRDWNRIRLIGKLGHVSFSETIRKLHEWVLNTSNRSQSKAPIIQPIYTRDISEIKIEELNFPLRIYKKLKRNNILTIGQLQSSISDEYCIIKGIGALTKEQIQLAINEFQSKKELFVDLLEDEKFRS